MIASGFDDISEEGSYKFANVKLPATANPSSPWVASQLRCLDLLPPPVPASWSPRELVPISSCPPGRPSNSVIPSAVSSRSLPLPRETLVLCVCGVRSDPIDVTATRPDDPFLHQEWERSPLPVRPHRSIYRQSWTSATDTANSPSAVSRSQTG